MFDFCCEKMLHIQLWEWLHGADPSGWLFNILFGHIRHTRRGYHGRVSIGRNGPYIPRDLNVFK